MNIILSRSTAVLLLGFGLSVFSGCVTVEPAPDFRRARDLVEASTGFPDIYNPEAPAITRQEIVAALADGLFIDEAVRIGLLNNRRLQSEFMSIGVAKADWVQSGLLSNPSLDMLVRFPVDGGRSQIEGLFVQNILELWRIPLRKEISQHRVDDAVFTIARIAADLVADTRSAYYEALAADELRTLAQDNLENARRTYEAVRNLREGGVASQFDENLAHGPVLEAHVSLRARELEARNARRRIASLLAIDVDVDDLVLLDSLPDPVAPELDVDTLIAIAKDARLDLQAYRAALAAAAVRINFESGKALGELSIGISVERPAVVGDTVVGPALTATIPIFDQNQAQVSRAEYLYLQAIKSLEAIELAMAQEIRGSVDRAATAASMVAFYERELLPQAEQNLEFARTAYTSGQATLIAMLETQRTFIEARTGYIQARRAAATATSRLEQAVGRPLSSLDVGQLTLPYQASPLGMGRAHPAASHPNIGKTNST